MIETDRFLIVDDCYNANPMSMKASLDVLKDGAGRRVAILGDMGELGENEVQLHAEVGEHAAQCGDVYKRQWVQFSAIINLFFDIRRNESQLHCVCGDSQGLSAFVL